MYSEAIEHYTKSIKKNPHNPKSCLWGPILSPHYHMARPVYLCRPPWSETTSFHCSLYLQHDRQRRGGERESREEAAGGGRVAGVDVGRGQEAAAVLHCDAECGGGGGQEQGLQDGGGGCGAAGKEQFQRSITTKPKESARKSRSKKPQPQPVFEECPAEEKETEAKDTKKGMADYRVKKKSDPAADVNALHRLIKKKLHINVAVKIRKLKRKFEKRASAKPHDHKLTLQLPDLILQLSRV